MAGGKSQLVFACEDFEAFLHIGSSPYGLIAFNEIGTRANGRNYWGQALAEKYDVTMLGLVSTKPNWFPARHMKDLLLIWSRQVQQLAVTWYGYGHSMGGYAALKFASLFETQASFSFCPQYSINPAVVGDFDPRYVEYFDEKLNQGMEVRSSDLNGRAFIFYDPLNQQDARHVDELKGLGADQVELIHCHYTGHETVRIFSGKRMLRLINAALSGDAHAIRRQVRDARQAKPGMRVEYLIERAVLTRPLTCLSILRAYHSLVSDRLLRFASAHFLNLEMPAEAFEVAAWLLERDDDVENRRHLIWLGRTARQSSDDAYLEWLVKKVLRRRPGLPMSLLAKHKGRMSDALIRYVSSYAAHIGGMREAFEIAEYLTDREDTDGANQKHKDWLSSL